MLQSQNSFLTLKGSKVREFLQGIITNDINQLTGESSLHTLLLNNRGKFLYDFFLYQIKENEVLVEYHPFYREGFLKLLSLYNLHKTIEIIEENYSSYIAFEKPSFFEYVFPLSKKLGFKVITEEKIESNQEIFKEYELRRIRGRIPDCSVDLISGSSFPLEYNLYSSFSFSKGCYVGQEVILRFRLPENLKRDIFVVYSEDRFPAPHTELIRDGEKVGKILSSQSKYGLALLEKDKVIKDMDCEGFNFIICLGAINGNEKS